MPLLLPVRSRREHFVTAFIYPKYARRSFIIVGGAKAGLISADIHVASLTPDLALPRLPLRVRPCPHASLPALVRSCDRQPTGEVVMCWTTSKHREERQKGEGSRAMSVVRETGRHMVGSVAVPIR